MKRTALLYSVCAKRNTVQFTTGQLVGLSIQWSDMKHIHNIAFAMFLTAQWSRRLSDFKAINKLCSLIADLQNIRDFLIRCLIEHIFLVIAVLYAHRLLFDIFRGRVCDTLTVGGGLCRPVWWRGPRAVSQLAPACTDASYTIPAAPDTGQTISCTTAIIPTDTTDIVHHHVPLHGVIRRQRRSLRIISRFELTHLI